MKPFPRLSLFLQQVGLTIALSVLLLLSALMLVLKTTMPQNSDEIPSVSLHTASTLSAMLIGAMLVSGAIFFLRKCPPRPLFICASVVYFLLSFILLFSYTEHLRGDAASTYEAAMDLKLGTLNAFLPGGYIHQHPHQIGLMYYYLLGTGLFGGVRWIYYANIMWGFLSNLAIWSIVRTYKHSTQTAEIASIIFPVVFLPHVLFNLYGYNHSPSLALSLCGLYFAQRFFNEEKIRYILAILLSFSAALLIRQNFQIMVLAAVLVSIIFLIRSVKFRRLLLLVAVTSTFIMPSLAQKGTEKYIGFEIGDGIPAVTWVAFGLQDSRVDEVRFEIYHGRLPGWFNHYSSTLWVSTNYSTEETRRIATEDLKHFARLRFSSPDHGAEFFTTKIASSWIEPSYQSVFFGALPAEDFFTNALLKDLYQGGQTHRYLTVILRAIVFAILLLSAIGIWRILKRKQSDFSALSIIAITVLGAFLFHLLWEIKGAYLYPYIFMLIPLCAIGLALTESTARGITSKLLLARKSSADLP